MKAILEFSLPDEEPQFRAALRGRTLIGLIANIRESLRSLLKHVEMEDDLQDKLNTIYADLCEESMEFEE